MEIYNDSIDRQIRNKYGWNNYMRTDSCSKGIIMIAYNFETLNHVFYSNSKDDFERLIEYDECGKIIHYEETGMDINLDDGNIHLPCNVRIAKRLILNRNNRSSTIASNQYSHAGGNFDVNDRELNIECHSNKMESRG